MIYRSEHLTLHSVMEVFRGEVNDVVICEEVSAGGGSYYTLLIVKEHEVVKKLLRIVEESEKDMSCCLEMFAGNDGYCLVFPYIKERKLSDFYMAKQTPLTICEDIALNLLLQCMTSPLPYPLLELVIKQRQIHLLKDNSVVLGYCIDLADLKEESGQKECTMQCAICIRELLQEKITKKNVSYQLLLKKIPKQSYHDFRELYKDIRLSKTTIEKVGIRSRIRSFFYRNQNKIFRILLMFSLVMVLLVLLMVLTDLVWGDIPFLRIFFNTFRQIGTESLVR